MGKDFVSGTTYPVWNDYYYDFNRDNWSPFFLLISYCYNTSTPTRFLLRPPLFSRCFNGLLVGYTFMPDKESVDTDSTLLVLIPKFLSIYVRYSSHTIRNQSPFFNSGSYLNYNLVDLLRWKPFLPHCSWSERSQRSLLNFWIVVCTYDL